MNDLTVVPKIAEWQRLKALVLDSVSSPITKRVYNMALDEFLAWFQQAPRPGFTKATVSAWRVSLEVRRLGSSSIIIRMSAIRKLAAEAADNGLLAPELAAGIARVKSAKIVGVRAGNWLSVRQAQSLLNAPDVTTVRGLRDRAILAVLLGCGLRRSEVAALTFTHIQPRDGRWCIVDLVGKHGRVRTAPMPTWVKVAIDAWTGPSGVDAGHVFRPVNRAGSVTGDRLGEKVAESLRSCGRSVISWSCSKGEVPMAPAPIFMAVIIGGIGITCVAWPLRVVAFCRWYHLKKPKWVQGLPFADMVMRPWMPTYFRIMGVFFCLFALGLVWIATTREFSN
jgi:hypothetical protein